MNIFDFLMKIADKLKGNTKLKSYCVSTFGRGPALFVGVDPDNLPNLQDNAPLIQVTVNRVEQPSSDNGHTLSIDMALGINIESGKLDTDASNDVRYYVGYKQIEEITDLCLEIIDEEMNSPIPDNAATLLGLGQTLYIPHLPYMGSETVLTIGAKNTNSTGD